MKFQSIHFLWVSVAALALCSLTSCGDIEQDLQLNADGSGKLETSFNLGEMRSMIEGFSDVGVEDVTISSDQEPDTSLISSEEVKDPMQALMDKVTDPEYDRDFDTLISFVSLMPDSVKEKETRMDLANKIALHLKSPAKSSDLTLGLVMNFDNQAQLKEIVDYMKNMDNSTTTSVMGDAGPGGIQSEAFLMFDADLKAGWIRFDTVDYSGLASEFGMSSDSLMSSEDMGMMEMMFGSSKIISTIHVPGEVTSCTNKEAILTKDDKVIVEHEFMDVIKNGKLDGFTIYFKPKK